MTLTIKFEGGETRVYLLDSPADWEGGLQVVKAWRDGRDEDITEVRFSKN